VKVSITSPRQQPERAAESGRGAGSWSRLSENGPKGTDSNRAGALLRAITEGTAAATGDKFFRSLVQHAATALEVRFCFVAECLPNRRARSLAWWLDGKLSENFEYELPGTPCMRVVEGRTCHYPDRIPELFPEDTAMIQLGTVSYLGVPLRDSGQRVIGHLVVFDDKPMPPDPLAVSVLETFAGRAGAELERTRAYENLQRLSLERETLLNINRAIGRHLHRDKLFGALAECLKAVLPADRFGIELPIEGNRLQGHILTPRDAGEEPTQPTVLPAAGTACDWVIQHRDLIVFALRDELRDRFPITFKVMQQDDLESLCVLPLVTGERSRGALFFMAAAPAAYQHLRRSFLEQVASSVAVALDDCLAHEEVRRLGDELAARKVAELEQEQRRVSDQLQQASEALDASEERFRDLFDEAPIAYVHENLDSRFIRANRAAMRVLGIRPEEVSGTYGKSFVPDTPEAQRRLREALSSIGRGTDTSGVVLELRRKDNGKPVWIQWWSRPDPGGTYTRTMFIDITDRVLMEQEKTRLEAQNTYLQEEIRAEHDFTEIVGNSPALRAVLRQVEPIAAADSTVLVLGETGTGKELIARAIHDRSPRRQHPLVKVNCGAISAGLVESELFGHVKGAFTGALTNRDGRFKLADGGTIFLDEVGELPPDTQVKLLRVLQEQEFEPVGSSQTVRVNVRVIAATNIDLGMMVSEGKFRGDLFYRLNVLPLTLPPLRERQGDVPLLVAFFVQRFGKKLAKAIKRVSEETMQRLAGYPWPGNIRELQNVIERAVVLSQGSTLELAPGFGPLQSKTSVPSAPLPASPRASDNAAAQSAVGKADPSPTPTPTPASTGGSLIEVERRHIESVLTQTNWMIEGERGAASVLNLNPSTLRSRMQKLGIKRPTKNTPQPR
jgi:formate hydrogenlyase transcriptional activator